MAGQLPFAGNSSHVLAKKIVNEQVDVTGPQWAHASSVSKEVAVGLLQRSVQSRMTVADLLEHEWLSETEEEVVVQLPGVPTKSSILKGPSFGKLA